MRYLSCQVHISSKCIEIISRSLHLSQSVSLYVCVCVSSFVYLHLYRVLVHVCVYFLSKRLVLVGQSGDSKIETMKICQFTKHKKTKENKTISICLPTNET